MASELTLLLIGAVAAATLMLALWLVHLPLGNAAVVDAGWAAGLALLAVLYAALAQGDPARAWLLAGMVTVWGLRLSLHVLLTRVIGHPEEGRYAHLREAWGGRANLKLLLFFQAQAVTCVVLSLPFLLAARDPAPAPRPLEVTATALWALAMAGEAIADRQLLRFKREPANRGKTCTVGLWRYSRHPNYFFEWLIWVAWALYALAAPWGVVGVIAPALILLSLLRVTGIPATEAQALRTRGEEYRRYQRTTSAFIPWLPRRVR